MNRIAVVGASGHGKVVAEIAEICGFEVVFVDDTYPISSSVECWPIVSNFNELIYGGSKIKYAIVAIGNNKVRSKLSKQLIDSGFELPVLVHPNAVVSKYATIESGTVICSIAVVNAFSKVGSNCIINTGAIVEHDCVLGDNVHLSPNVSLAGGTIISDLVWLGIGSVTKELVRIGRASVIGANSTVLSDITAGVTVYGSPAVRQVL